MFWYQMKDHFMLCDMSKIIKNFAINGMSKEQVGENEVYCCYGLSDTSPQNEKYSFRTSSLSFPPTSSQVG